jgi:MoaA/NifB/PqqE/SkfB family radical SAM enzyme
MKNPECETKYGFYDRLKADFPSQIIVDISEVCNLECIHCPHPEFRKSEYYSGRFMKPELNAKLVDEVGQHGQGRTMYIRYCSEGEPLLHPKGYEMIEYATRESDVYVTLTTNGTIMNEKRIGKLLDAGVHMIDISIDAFTNETYARIRRKGDLNVTRTNVLRLIKQIEIARSKTTVVVSFVEQPENRHEINDFEAFWKDNGASYVVIRKLHSASGTLSNIADQMKKDNATESRRPCVYPWGRIVLNPRGHLAFCPADWTHGSTIADYRSTTIYETWHSEFYDELRNAHLANDFAHHEFCGQCPDWKLTHWPEDGRSYADMIEELREDV